MKKYIVKYVMFEHDNEHEITVIASNKEGAYDKAVNELIPAENDGDYCYGAWVDGVTYANGNVHYFNTCLGLPY